MVHRKEGRFKLNQIATLRALSMTPVPVMETCILDISSSGMRLRSELPLTCGLAVEVEVNDRVSRGTVCSCEAKLDSYELGVAVSERGRTLEQRKQGRFNVNDVATIRELGQEARIPIDVSIVDISKDGMRLRSKLPVACGAPIEIKVRDTVVLGSVHRRVPSLDYYEIAVLIHAISPALTVKESQETAATTA